MKKIPTQAENPHGLHHRYNITHADGSPVDPDAVYFVLRLDKGQKDKAHMVACCHAARAYINSVRSSITADHLLKVANDLYKLLR